MPKSRILNFFLGHFASCSRSFGDMRVIKSEIYAYQVTCTLVLASM
jgi:hypothetical protein